jgi:hypothetical protein
LVVLVSVWGSGCEGAGADGDEANMEGGKMGIYIGREKGRLLRHRVRYVGTMLRRMSKMRDLS